MWFNKFAIFWEYLVTMTAPIWSLNILILICIIKDLISENALSHWLHWYGFSSVWILIWYIRTMLDENASSQWQHWNGLFPVWNLMWFIITLLYENASLHCLHWYGFSQVWILICFIGSLLGDNSCCKGYIDVVYPQGCWAIPSVNPCVFNKVASLWEYLSTLAALT